MNLWIFIKLLPTKNFVENECLLIVTQQVSDIKATMFYSSPVLVSDLWCGAIWIELYSTLFGRKVLLTISD